MDRAGNVHWSKHRANVQHRWLICINFCKHVEIKLCMALIVQLINTIIEKAGIKKIGIINIKFNDGKFNWFLFLSALNL